MLISENLVFDYLERGDPSSNIKADWLIKGMIKETQCYLFLRNTDKTKGKEDRSNLTYCCCSFFPYSKIKYGLNARKMTIMKKNKLILSSHTNEILYENSKYTGY